jgi:toxin ParE1/3/4
MDVLFSHDAEADLADIGAYIGADNTQRAITFVQELRRRCEALAEVPHAFPVLRLRSGVELRRRPYGSYLIFYRVTATAIIVMRVLHGARDYERLLASDPDR